MSLLNTSVRLWNTYLQTFPHPTPLTRLSVGVPSGNPTVVYYDRDDVFYVCLNRTGGGQTSARVDANLIDVSSANVGMFISPVANSNSTFFAVGDYSPTEGTQRLFQALAIGDQNFQELDPADPEILLNSNVWGNVQQNGSDNGKTSANAGYINGTSQALGWALFPEIDLAVVTGARINYLGTLYDNCIGLVTLSTGDGIPLSASVVGPTSAVPGRYASGEHAYNQSQIFGETEARFTGVQFVADADSSHDRPKGYLIFGSSHITTAPCRVYVRLNEWNPTGKVAAPGTPNRVHLRQILLSRLEYVQDTIPSGDPLAPTNAVAGSSVNHVVPQVFFTARGARRLMIIAADGTVNPQTGTTTQTEYSFAAAVDVITKASEIGSPLTNKTTRAQVVVAGSLGERIANIRVDFTLERLSSVGEVLPVTYVLSEVVQVANPPIDRTNIAYPKFGVFKDGVAITEGAGAGQYQVNEATGEIDFGASEPVAPSIYTINYAHPDTPATPPHGTLLDVSVFTDVFGVAETRISYPDNDALEDEIDQLTADTA